MLRPSRPAIEPMRGPHEPFLLLLGRGASAFYEFDNRHGRVVPHTVTELENSSVATGPVSITFGELVKDLGCNIAFADDPQCSTTVVQTPLLAEGDHPIRDPPNLSRFRIGGLNTLVLEQ